MFRSPEKSEKILHRLLEECLSSGSRYAPEDLSAELTRRLADAPDPDMVVRNLLRFVEASLSRTSLFNDLLDYPVVLEVLLSIFSQSQYLSDILVRDPALFRWLTTTDVLHRPVHSPDLEAEVRRIRDMLSGEEKRLDALRRLYRREILRIGAQDILERAPLVLITQQLSDLADVLIQAALTIAQEALERKYGRAPATRYAVIGLGKLGGGELNYSSDIDLLCLYEEEGELRTERTISYHEFFHQLTERFIQNLSTASPEGHLYRVDMRLRPESGAGPLARSLASTIAYYESRGELWERQMLIKARVVAGDRQFGGEFLQRLEPFVYPRTLFQHPSRYVARIKARIEAAVGEKKNVKLMPGGIRDIEFTVQVLQLLHGGRNPDVRTGNTLEALRKLAEHKLLSTDESGRLTRAYETFRTIEHRLQMMLNTQVHTLPEEKEDVELLARRLGYPDGRELAEIHRMHSENVRAVFDDVMSVPVGAEGRGGEPDPVFAIVEGGVSEAMLADVLRRQGHRDLRQAATHLRVLTAGGSLMAKPEYEARTREALREVAPFLFPWIAQSPDPDLTLANLATLVGGGRFPHQFFAQMMEPGFRRFVLEICARSPWVVRELSKDPLLLEFLTADVGALSRTGVGELEGTPERYKVNQEIRACVRNLLGFSTFDVLADELTAIADTLVRRASASGPGRMAVFGLGKLGSRELNFRGDLDIIFVSDGCDPAEAERGATDTLRFLTAHGGSGAMYEVDIRLRPEGRNAPLVADVGAFRRYIEKRASLWERQSFTRMRYICGDEGIRDEVEALVSAWVYETYLPDGWTETILEMRRRMEPRSHFRGPGPLNLKRSAGGMVDIEFLAQMIQLKGGASAASLRSRPVREILAADPACVLRDDERRLLSESYLQFREVEKTMRVTLEERSAVIPEGEKLDRLARCYNRSSAAAFLPWLSGSMLRVRGIFLEVRARLAVSPHHQ